MWKDFPSSQNGVIALTWVFKGWDVNVVLFAYYNPVIIDEHDWAHAIISL